MKKYFREKNQIKCRSTNLVLLLIMLSIAVPCMSQQDTTRIAISEFDSHGHQQFSKKEIVKILPPGTYSPEQLKSAIHKLLQEYQRKGFYFTQIETKDSAANFYLHINEGPALGIGKIKISGNDSLITSQLESLLDFRQRGSIVELLDFNIEQLLQYLENHGYPFGVLSVDSLLLTSDADSLKRNLACYLRVDPGPQVAIDSIAVQGNDLTKFRVVARETRLKQGEIYNHQRVVRIQDRLLRTGFFSQVDEPQISLDARGRGHLLISVKEGNPNQLNAVLGYNPGVNKQTKGYMTGLIDVAFRNLLGTGRVVEAFWTKKDQRSQELRFRYLEPWVFGYPIDIGGGFQQTIQDTSFIRRNLLADMRYSFSDVLTFETTFGKEDVLPDSIGQILYQLPKSNAWLAKIGLSYDTRDDVWNPSHGIFYGTQFEYGRKRIFSIPGENQEAMQQGAFRRDRWLLDFEVYVPTLKWQTVLLGVHGRQVKSNEALISVADLFRFGGTRSLRGYREDQLWGEKIAWLNLEYRYLLAARSRVFLFLDSGYFMQKDDQQKLLEDYKFGYGFGLRIETRLGIIGIDYGLGEGRGLTSGLVHVGLTNKF